jgi:regulator of replication initiation timing
MNDIDHIKDLNAEVADLSVQLRQAGAEISRLREQIRQAGEENARLRQESAALKRRLQGEPESAPVAEAPVQAPVVSEYQRLVRELQETKSKLGADPVEPIDNDAVSARKRKLSEEIERARETITQAAMIKQQMAELERMTQTLAEENERLRVEAQGPVSPSAPEPAKAVPPPLPSLSLSRQMIRPPQPPTTAGKVVAAPEPADTKLKVMLPQAEKTNTSASDMSGRRMVFLNSLFGKKKD